MDSCQPRFEPDEYDFWIPILSVAGPLRVTPDKLPGSIPFLFPKTDDSAVIAKIGEMPGLRVGLCWRSRKEGKTLPLEAFRDVMEIPGIRTFAIGEKKYLDEEVPGFSTINLGANDILGTTSAILAMDLIVTVDTMVSHLAGALGKPVLLLLHRLPGGRWGATGELTPWYPTMRLIRQQRDGRWEPVMRKVSETLREWASSGVPDFLSFWPKSQTPKPAGPDGLD